MDKISRKISLEEFEDLEFKVDDRATLYMHK